MPISLAYEPFSLQRNFVLDPDAESSLELIFPNFQVRQLHITPIVSSFGQSALINTLAFDTHEELLWIGDNHVRLSIVTTFSCPGFDIGLV